MLGIIPLELRDYARQTLVVLCCATRPLTAPELIDALAVEVSDSPRFDATRNFQNADAL